MPTEIIPINNAADHLQTLQGFVLLFKAVRSHDAVYHATKSLPALGEALLCVRQMDLFLPEVETALVELQKILIKESDSNPTGLEHILY